MQIFFAFLVFYFWMLRRSRSGFRQWKNFLGDFASRHGGNVFRSHGRRLLYIPVHRDWEVEVRSKWSTQMTIRIRKTFPYSVVFVRLPRLLYAFLEAYIDPVRRHGSGPYYLYGAAEQISELKEIPGFLPLFEELNTAGFSLKIGRSGLKLWKTLSRNDRSEASFEGYLRMTRDFAQLCSGEFVEIPVHEVPSEQHCAYCKEMLDGEELLTRCAVCGTPHHSDCFQLNGKCSVFGCESNNSRPTSPEMLRA